MTAPHDAGRDPKRATLSRELAEFLIELSIALHKHAMYPSGHPSLAPAAEGVVRRAAVLLGDRSSISMGVARNQLVIEGVATDSKHPVLADLARRLHNHHLGAITFYQGIGAKELVNLLHTLAADPERDGHQPLGLGPQENLQAWKHARLHALAYDRLELLNEGGAEKAVSEEEAGAAGRKVRSAQLWIGLARAALTGHSDDSDEAPAAATMVARAIDDHPSSAAYDQVIVGYLLQIAEELRSFGGEGAVELRRRTSVLLRALRPETLQRLVTMGGDATQRRRFINDAADGMAVDAVVEIMKAAAEASHQQISHSLVRLLSKLAAHAENGTPGSRPVADSGLREQVRRLLSDWDLRDPNPDAYGVALDKIARSTPLFLTLGGNLQTPDDERIIQISLEIGQGGPRVKEALATLVAEGRYGELAHMVERAPPSRIRDSVQQLVAAPSVLASVLAAEQIDFVLVDRLIALMGAEAAVPLVDTLAESDSRSVRRNIVTRLVALGTAIVPVVMTRLDDQRWYVVRNLLALIADLPEMPFGFSAAPFTAHVDPRVRRQALRMQMLVPEERERALAIALADRDEEVVRLGLYALEKDVPDSVVPRVVQLALNKQEPSELRQIAIRALGHAHAVAARDALITLVNGGRTWLGRIRLSPRSPEMLAALRALAAGWSDADEPARFVARARASGDPAVRAAVGVVAEN